MTSEVAPFSKTGGAPSVVPLGDIFATSMLSGLGEAMDGLPIALAALGHRCMVISPRSSALNAGKIRGAQSLLLPCSGYDQYKEAWDTGYWSSVPMGGKNESVHFFHTYKQKARCHSSMAWHPSAVAGVRSSSQVDYVFVDHPTFLERVNGLAGPA